MSKIDFSKEEKKILVEKLKKYLNDELDIKIGQFDADFLLDFVGKELGAYYYNRGLLDAQAVVATRLDMIADAIYEIEQPTTFSIRD